MGYPYDILENVTPSNIIIWIIEDKYIKSGRGHKGRMHYIGLKCHKSNDSVNATAILLKYYMWSTWQMLCPTSIWAERSEYFCCFCYHIRTQARLQMEAYTSTLYSQTWNERLPSLPPNSGFPEEVVSCQEYRISDNVKKESCNVLNNAGRTWPPANMHTIKQQNTF